MNETYTAMLNDEDDGWYYRIYGFCPDECCICKRFENLMHLEYLEQAKAMEG